jgi:hypothetical protein
VGVFIMPFIVPTHRFIMPNINDDVLMLKTLKYSTNKINVENIEIL